MVGDFFEPPGVGGGFRDVVVAVEPHFVPEMRFIRVVRMSAPTPDDPQLARGAAVRAYLDRCNQLGLAPSGWVNRIEPNWWGGMPFEEVVRLADAPGALAQPATDELWRRGFFKAGGEWVPHIDSGRGSGIAVGLGTVVRTRGRPTPSRKLQPNQSTAELRYEFLHTTPEQRLRAGIELSQTAALLALRGRERTAS